MTQQEYQRYQQLALLVYYLQQETWPLESPDKLTALAEVIKIAGELGIKKEYTDPEFLSTVAEEIAAILKQPLKQPAPNIDVSRLKEWRQQLEAAKQEQKARTAKIIFPTTDEQIKNALKVHQQKIKEILVSTTKLDEQAAEEISSKVTLENKLPVSRPEAFPKEEYQKIIQENIIPVINQELAHWGLGKTQIENKKSILAEELTTKTYESAKKLVSTPHLPSLPPKPTSIPKEIPPLSQEMITKLNQKPEAVVLPSVFILLHPEAANALIRKVVSAPSAGLIRNAIKNASPTWQTSSAGLAIKEMVEKGIFAEDIEASIKTLINMGLTKDHPIIQALKDKSILFREFQKYKDTNKNLPWVRVIKNQVLLDRLFGKGVFDENLIKGYYPSSAVEPIWSQKGSWGYTLHHGLNSFNFIPNTSKRMFVFITRGKYESLGGIIKGTFYQKGIRPFFVSLGKTSIGKTSKNILVKFSTRFAAKLGLSTLTAGWGTFISFLPEIKKLGKKVLAFFGGLFLWAAHYGTAAIIGALGGSLGGLLTGGFLGFKFGALIGTSFSIIGTVVGAIVGFLVGAIVGFFGGVGIQLLIDKISTSLSGPPLFQKAAAASSNITTSAVATSGNVVLGSIAGIGVGVLIITQITASAFIMEQPEELEGSPYIELIKKGEFTGNAETGEGEIIYQVSLKTLEKKLINIKITDRISTRCEQGNPTINEGLLEKPPEIMEANNSWATSYSLKTNSSFNNCLVINDIKVTGQTEDTQEEQFKIAGTVIVIGNPPDDCPYGWPTNGTISDIIGSPRPNGRTHRGIDISNNSGTPIYATHGGKAEKLYEQGGGGYYVRITGSCNKIPFTSYYFHMLDRGRRFGEVGGCDPEPIGLMGSTGYSTGPHLHYEIRDLGANWANEFLPPFKKYNTISNSCGL